MLSLLIGPLLAPRAFSRRPLSVDRRPPVMTYKANTRQARRPKKGRPTPRRPEMEFFLTVAFLINGVEGRFQYCMSSEHFGQLAWQFKRMSGSSGLKVQAAIAC